MATGVFNATSYSVSLRRHPRFNRAAYIVCRGDGGCYVGIDFIISGQPIPANYVHSGCKSGGIKAPEEHFSWYIDLLRNEKPVRVYLNSDSPEWNALFTGYEPVGEEEQV